MRTLVLTTILLATPAAALLALDGSLAHGDPRARPMTPEAKEHLTRGNRLYQIREFEKAIEEYKAGALKGDSPTFAYNLAQCYRQLGLYEEAIWHYERFLNRAQPTGEMKDAIEGFLAQMKAEIATRSTPAVPVDPVAPNPALMLRQPEPTQQPRSQEIARSPRRTVPLILIGAGAAAVLTGGIVYAFDEDDPDGGPLMPTHRNTAPYGIAIGAAGVAAIGAASWLWWRHSNSAPTVAVTPSSALVAWAGSF